MFSNFTFFADLSHDTVSVVSAWCPRALALRFVLSCLAQHSPVKVLPLDLDISKAITGGTLPGPPVFLLFGRAHVKLITQSRREAACCEVEDICFVL
jgi:hypothetical protein